MRTEATLYTKDSQVNPYEEILSVDWNASEHESVASRLCLLRIFHAKRLHEHGYPERAAEELKKAEQQIYENTGKMLDAFNIRYSLLSAMAKASIHPLPTAEARVQQHRDLARQAASLGDRTIQRGQLFSMIEHTRELTKRVDSGSSTLVTHMVLREMILENLSFADGAHPHPSTVASCLLELEGYQYFQSELQWFHHLSRFSERWPDFDVPSLLARLLDLKYRLVQMIDGEEVAASILPEHVKALANTPNVRRARNGTLEALNDEGELLLEVSSYNNVDDRYRDMLYVIKLLIRWIRDKISDGMPEPQARKILCVENYSENWLDSIDPIDVAIRIFGRDDPVENTKWKPWLDEVVRWLTGSAKSPSEVDRHQQLVRICGCRKSTLTKHLIKIQAGSPKEFFEFQQQSRDESEIFIQIHKSLLAEAVSDLTLWRLKADLIWADYILMLCPYGQESGRFTDEAIAGIQERFEEHFEFLRSYPLKQMLFNSLKQLARVYWARWLGFDTIPLTKALEALQEAEKLFQDVIGQSFVLQSLQAFASQIQLADNFKVSDLYENGVLYTYKAMCRCLQKNKHGMEEDPNQRAPDDLNQIVIGFVQWAQKSKGRAIALAIGVGSQVPREFLESAWASSPSKELMAKYDELRQELGPGTSILRSIAIYEEIESIWNTMESDSSGTAFLGMLRGRTADTDDLALLGAILGEDVIFVDWIQISDMGGSGDLAMAVYQKGLLVDVLRTDVRLTEVEEWVLENLEPTTIFDDEEEADRYLPLTQRKDTGRLREMNNLLKGLEHFTKPGEVLVFCPTKAMNRIPLHALMLDNEVCICRNPVVYCQSLTLLRICFLDRISLAEKMGLSNRRAVVIDPLATDPKTTAALSDIGTTLGTDVARLDPHSNGNLPHTDNNNGQPDRRQTFAHLARDASMLHFHGHVVFNPSNPMKHHLQLAPQSFSLEGDPLPLHPNAQLTVHDVFKMRFRPGTHVTTISCKSARAHVTKVDDHIGLVTAFHSAGAASMISSLWNIYDDTGIRFSKLFYENLRREKERFFLQPHAEKKREEWEKIKELPYLDMARAMQKTIVEIRKDERSGEVLPPYYWAGLVLSGNWAMPRVWIEEESKD